MYKRFKNSRLAWPAFLGSIMVAIQKYIHRKMARTAPDLRQDRDTHNVTGHTVPVPRSTWDCPAKNNRRHILFVCTEDWFFRSHFLPLDRAARSVASWRTTVLCTGGEASGTLEQSGIRVIPVDFSRQSANPFRVMKLLWQLATLFRREKPDLIHFIALKPIILGGLSSLVLPRAARAYHLTGLGFLTASDDGRHLTLRKIFLYAITQYLKRKNSWLVLENPDDRDALRKVNAIPEDRLSILGGAGVDPAIFREQPFPDNSIPRMAFVGRMVWSKGVDTLADAMDILATRNVAIGLDLYGAPDNRNPRAISRETLEGWNERPDIFWHGRTSDITRVWAIADFAVIPSRGGEGLPRALLEAASCGRALVVTDVPGCRHFVRDGIEGLVVPPNDPGALANAIAILAADPALRHRMGQAARQRVLDGFTERHVHTKMLEIYRTLLEPE